MRTSAVAFAAVLVACFGPVAPQAQQIGPPTLLEVARRVAPDPVRLVRHVEHVVEAVETMVPRAHLVVCGSVTAGETRLSADETDLETHYSFRPDRVILEQPVAGQPSVDTSSTITIYQPGGQMTLEGTLVTIEDDELRSLQVGERLVLFLEYDAESATFSALTVSGIWSVTNAGVVPIMKHRHPILDRFRGMALEQFETEIRRLAP